MSLSTLAVSLIACPIDAHLSYKSDTALILRQEIHKILVFNTWDGNTHANDAVLWYSKFFKTWPHWPATSIFSCYTSHVNKTLVPGQNAVVCSMVESALHPNTIRHLCHVMNISRKKLCCKYSKLDQTEFAKMRMLSAFDSSVPKVTYCGLADDSTESRRSLTLYIHWDSTVFCWVFLYIFMAFEVDVMH